MKKIAFIFTLISGMVFLQNCTGPEGPRGPQGFPGIPGPDSEVFEVTTSFISANGYESIFVLDPPIRPEDNILVYELAGVHNGRDIWKLLPQTYYFDEGVMLYNFDFTTHDFRLFMDSTFNLSLLDSSWKNNITFRIVIVPGYFSLDGINLDDIDAVMGVLNLTDDSVQLLD